MNGEQQAEARSTLMQMSDAGKKVCFIIARALQPVIPAGWHGRLDRLLVAGDWRPHRRRLAHRPALFCRRVGVLEDRAEEAGGTDGR